MGGADVSRFVGANPQAARTHPAVCTTSALPYRRCVPGTLRKESQRSWHVQAPPKPPGCAYACSRPLGAIHCAKLKVVLHGMYVSAYVRSPALSTTCGFCAASAAMPADVFSVWPMSATRPMVNGYAPAEPGSGGVVKLNSWLVPPEAPDAVTT